MRVVSGAHFGVSGCFRGVNIIARPRTSLEMTNRVRAYRSRARTPLCVSRGKFAEYTRENRFREALSRAFSLRAESGKARWHAG